MEEWESFGATLAVVASIISNLGVNVQKYSHAADAQLPPDEQRPYVQRPLWWIGLTLVVLGSIGDFTAFGFATQSLVAALGGGATLVANVFTAYFLNREPLYMFVIYIASVGVLMVSMLAGIKGSVANRLKNQMQSSKRKQKQLMQHLEGRIQRIEQRLSTMEHTLREQQRRDDGGDTTLDPLLPNDPTMAERPDTPVHAAKHKHADLSTPFGELLEGVTNPVRVPYYYAICSGIIGSMTVLLAKCSAVMIRLSLKGENQFHYPLTYVFIGGMFVCIIIQTHFLNMATSLGDIMTVFPIFQACWISFSVIGGAVFYESSKSFTPQKWLEYPLALLFIAVGVALLVQHQSSAEHSSTKGSGVSKSKEYGLLADDEVCLITDTSMRSPLLAEGNELDDAGYLHLEA
ncbi:hypothetical protein ATCC90586_009145 [Pythium insidiosum]|nr:hypothetical protein ATCC90586_009145 [Pythium insidiosum]